jgi:hypothetical protein
VTLLGSVADVEESVPGAMDAVRAVIAGFALPGAPETASADE